MKQVSMRAGLAGVVLSLATIATFNSSEAACRQMLAPNGWQYITVCDGYRGGGNYAGAISAGIAAAGIAMEVLPDVLNGLGDVTNGVGKITSGVNEPLQNFLSSTNRNTGGQNDGTLNPFNLFNQPAEASPPPGTRKNVKQEETPSIFPNIFAPQTPTVNTPHVNARTPQVTTPHVNANPPTVHTPNIQAIIPNIFAPQPQVNVHTPRVNTPQVRAPAPNVYNPMAQ